MNKTIQLGKKYWWAILLIVLSLGVYWYYMTKTDSNKVGAGGAGGAVPDDSNTDDKIDKMNGGSTTTAPPPTIPPKANPSCPTSVEDWLAMIEQTKLDIEANTLWYKQLKMNRPTGMLLEQHMQLAAVDYLKTAGYCNPLEVVV